MASPYLGSITLFAGTFAPRGYMFCNGQLLAIQQYSALFSLLGTTYGGNGQTTFSLPDLRGRVPIGFGQGNGLSNYVEGQTGGVESVTLQASQIPSHSHAPLASTADETTNRPGGAYPTKGGVYSGSTDNTVMGATTASGGGQAHENRPPFLALNYIIAVEGIYPSRN